jgi:vanillate/3-O-methylgallate O-demethylase
MTALGGPVQMLRNSSIGPYSFPIAAEFTNWRDEQESWRKTAALMDQSVHMTDLYISGPDTIKLLSNVGVNSFAGYRRNQAKQLIVCNYDGYVIGDAILFGLEDDRVSVVGRPPTCNWIEYQAAAGRYNVTVERDERALDNSKPRFTYRYQVQGPAAWNLLEKCNGKPIPDVKFFKMTEITIGGCRVRALRHGFAGAPGLELFGPTAEGAAVRAALMEIGEEFGLRAVGARAYSTVAMESGWLPSPLPAIYSGEQMKPYREWLKATSFEATASLGGSYDPDDISAYYLTPWDIDYGRLIRYDHDFIGRSALERLANAPHRRKVTLVWEPEDVISAFATLFQDERVKYLDLPGSQYTTHPYDCIYKDGQLIGISTYAVYSSNARRWISLAMIDEAQAASGNTVTVTWGEKNGGTRKSTVERHVQKSMRATVVPSPYATEAREQYRPFALK